MDFQPSLSPVVVPAPPVPVPVPVRVLLLDPDPLAQDCIRAQLEQHGSFELVGAVATGREAVELVVSRRPHLLVIDLKSTGAEGLVASRRARTVDSNVGIVVQSVAPSDQLVLLALTAGAVATIDKQASGDHLPGVLLAVAAGGAAIPATVTRRLVQGMWPFGHARAADDVAHLTQREWRVLELACDGCALGEASVWLGLSRRTVSRYLAEVQRKLASCGLAPGVAGELFA
jgi:DNA-binding NarL/FixJ family response regulator